MDDTSLARTLEMPTTKPYKPVQATGTRYAVVPLGKFFEVRRRKYSHGRIVEDQFVTAFPSEQDADAAARYLSGVGS